MTTKWSSQGFLFVTLFLSLLLITTSAALLTPGSDCSSNNSPYCSLSFSYTLDASSGYQIDPNGINISFQNVVSAPVTNLDDVKASVCSSLITTGTSSSSNTNQIGPSIDTTVTCNYVIVKSNSIRTVVASVSLTDPTGDTTPTNPDPETFNLLTSVTSFSPLATWTCTTSLCTASYTRHLLPMDNIRNEFIVSPNTSVLNADVDNSKCVPTNNEVVLPTLPELLLSYDTFTSQAGVKRSFHEFPSTPSQPVTINDFDNADEVFRRSTLSYDCKFSFKRSIVKSISSVPNFTIGTGTFGVTPSTSLEGIQVPYTVPTVTYTPECADFNIRSCKATITLPKLGSTSDPYLSTITFPSSLTKISSSLPIITAGTATPTVNSAGNSVTITTTDVSTAIGVQVTFDKIFSPQLAYNLSFQPSDSSVSFSTSDYNIEMTSSIAINPVIATAPSSCTSSYYCSVTVSTFGISVFRFTPSTNANIISFADTLSPTTFIPVGFDYTLTPTVAQTFTVVMRGSGPPTPSVSATLNFLYTLASNPNNSFTSPPLTISSSDPYSFIPNASCDDVTQAVCAIQVVKSVSYSLPTTASFSFNSFTYLPHYSSTSFPNCSSLFTATTSAGNRWTLEPKIEQNGQSGGLCWLVMKKTTIQQSGPIVSSNQSTGQTITIGQFITPFITPPSEQVYCDGGNGKIAQIPAEGCSFTMRFNTAASNLASTFSELKYVSRTNIFQTNPGHPTGWEVYYNSPTHVSEFECVDITSDERIFVLTVDSTNDSFSLEFDTITDTSINQCTINMKIVPTPDMGSLIRAISAPFYLEGTDITSNAASGQFIFPSFFQGLPFSTSSDSIPQDSSDTTAPYTFTIITSLWKYWSSADVTVYLPPSQIYKCDDSSSVSILSLSRTADGRATLSKLLSSDHVFTTDSITCTFEQFPVDGLGTLIDSVSYPVSLQDPTNPQLTWSVNIPANFPRRETGFTIKPLSPCIGVQYCTLILNFPKLYTSIELNDVNHFNLGSNAIYSCRSRDATVATVALMGDLGNAKLIITPQGLVEDDFDAGKHVECYISLPISSTTVRNANNSIQSTLKSASGDETSKVALPQVSRDSIITLQPQLCRVGITCQYQFVFGVDFISQLPLMHFDANFDGQWNLLDSNYCHLSQNGRDITIQIISPYKYSSDTVPSCLFSVTPLNLPKSGANLLQIEIYSLVDFTQLSSLISSNAPIPFTNISLYKPSELIPKWIINDITIFNAVQTTDAVPVQVEPIVVNDETEIVVQNENDQNNENNQNNNKNEVSMMSTLDTTSAELITGLSSSETGSILGVSPIDSCLGASECKMSYSFNSEKTIRTVRFVNFFLIDHPNYVADCINPSTGNIIGKLTVSSQLRYLYLRSVDDNGFPQTACQINYEIKGTKTSLPILHQYEFIGNSLNTNNPSTTEYSNAAVSDAFNLPSFSPYKVTILNSFIQEHSAQNYITLLVQTSNELNAASIKLNSMSLTLIGTNSISGAIFDMSQMECVIPPSSVLAVQPTCHATPSNPGISITFDLATTSNTQYIILTWTQGPRSTPSHLPALLAGVKLNYGSDFTFKGLTGLDDSQRDSISDTLADNIFQKSLIQIQNSDITLYSLSSPQMAQYAIIASQAVASLVVLQPYYAFTMGAQYDPRFWISSHYPNSSPPQALTQPNIYLATNQAPLSISFDVGVDASIVIGSEIILQMVYSGKDGTRQPLSYDITNLVALSTPGSDNISLNSIAPTPTCTFCRVFEVVSANGAPKGTAVKFNPRELTIVYTDFYNSYEQPTTKSYLRMAIKTYLSRREGVNRIPEDIVGGISTYDPEITTVYNYKFAQWFVLYNYNVAGTVHYSKTAATVITTAMAGEEVEFRFDVTGAMDTLTTTVDGQEIASFVPEIFRNDISNAIYSYTLTGCAGWVPPAGSPYCTESSGVITCQNIGVGTSTDRAALMRFSLTAPASTRTPAKCTMKTSLSVDIVTLRNASTATKTAFTWDFNQAVDIPSLVTRSGLTFPQSAVVCSNQFEPVFVAGGPGVYRLEVPDGFIVPATTTGAYSVASSGQLTTGGRDIVIISIGSSFEIPTEAQLYSTVPIYLSLTCPQDGRDIRTTRWVYSFTPHNSARGTGLEASIGRWFVPKLGYYVLTNDGQLSPQHWVQYPLNIPTLSSNPSDINVMNVLFTLHTSIRHSSTITLSPPASFKFPIIQPNLSTSSSFIYKYREDFLDPATQSVDSRITSVVVKAFLDSLDTTAMVVQFTQDMNLFSINSPSYFAINPTGVKSDSTPCTLIPTTIPEQLADPDCKTTLGAQMQILLLSPFEGNLDLKQCFGASCNYIAPVPVQLIPEPQVSIDFVGQFQYPIRSVITMNTALHVTDTVTLTLTPPTQNPQNLPLPIFVDNHFEFPNYSVTVRANQIILNVARYISANTQIPFFSQITVQDVSLSEQKFAVGWTLRHSAPNSGSSHTDTLYTNIPSTINIVRKPLISFQLLSGFHLDSPLTFQFKLGREWLFGQSVIFTQLPIAPLKTSIFVCPTSGYKFMLSIDYSRSSTAGWSELKIESVNDTVIPAETLITIQVTSLISSVDMVVQSLSIYSTGIGSESLPIDLIQVLDRINILPVYNAAFQLVGSPAKDGPTPTSPAEIIPMVAPHYNTYLRLSQVEACLPEQVCFVLISVLRTNNQGIPLPENGLDITISFDGNGGSLNNGQGSGNTDAVERGYALSGSVVDQNFDQNSTTKDEYFSNPTTVEWKVTSRTYSLSNQSVKLHIDRVSQNGIFQFIVLPVVFAKSQLDGYLTLSITTPITTGSTPTDYRLFQTTFSGPSVFRSSWGSSNTPHFYYINGGSFADEVISVGVRGVGSLMPQTSSSEATMDLQTPVPRTLRASYTFPASYGIPTATDNFVSVGLRNHVIYEAVTTSPQLFRGYGENPIENELFGATNLQTFAATSEYTLNMFVFNAMSETDAMLVTLNEKPQKPIKFNEAKWTFQVYSNRGMEDKAIGNAVQKFPIISYKPVDLVTTGIEVPGFEIRKSPWIRVKMSRVSIDILRDVTGGINGLPSPYVPQVNALTMTIIQQWPGKDKLNAAKLAEIDATPGWKGFKLHPTDSVFFTIPDFYQVEIGSYSCANSAAQLEWNGQFFTLHFEPFTSPEVTTSPQYSCTVPITAIESKLPTGTFSPEMTASWVDFSTMDNSENHLPASSSTDISPILGDSPTATIRDEYLQFYMPLPIAEPRYHIEMNDVEIVGLPGKLILTIENGRLQRAAVNSRARTLTYLFSDFPIVLDSGIDKIGTNCYNNEGIAVAVVSILTGEGLEFRFNNQFATSFVQCSLIFTAGAPFQHHGLSITTLGYSSTSPTLYTDTVRPLTTIEFTTSNVAKLRPTQIRPNNPYISLQGTLIKGLTTRITITGKEFAVTQPSLVVINGITTPVNSTLSVSVGVPFKAGWGGSRIDLTGLQCMTLSNTPFAEVTFTFAGQSKSTLKPSLVPESGPVKGQSYASEDGQNGIAHRFTLNFYQSISPESTWSCSFDISPTQDSSSRLPDSTLHTGVESITTLLQNEMLFQPRTKVNLGFVQGQTVTKSMSSITFYYNSTMLYLNDESVSHAPELVIGIPVPVLTYPFDGAQCWLNHLKHARLPFSLKSASSIDTFYTIPLQRYINPTGQELNRVFCIIPNLSTKTQPESSRGTIRFGKDMIFNSFSLPFVPSTNLHQADLSSIGSITPAIVPNSANPQNGVVHLTAYQNTWIKYNLTNFNTLNPLIFATQATNWALKTASVCAVNPLDPEFLKWVANPVGNSPKGTVLLAESQFGMISLSSVTAASCYIQVNSIDFDFSDEILALTGLLQTCNPQVTGCSWDSISFLYLPHGALQVYTTKIDFKPLLRLKNDFKPRYFITPGFVEYEYSGLNADTDIVITLTTSNANIVFDAEVNFFDHNGNPLTASTTKADGPVGFPVGIRSSLMYFSPTVPLTNAIPADVHNAQVDPNTWVLKVSPGKRWIDLNTIRISYIVTEPRSSIEESSIKIDIDASYSGSPSGTAPLKTSYVTNSFVSIPSDYNSNNSFPQTPTSSPALPRVVITPPAALKRGVVNTFAVTMTNVAPFTKGFNLIPLVEFPYITGYIPNPDPTTAPMVPFIPALDSPYYTQPDSSNANWHVQSPYGNQIVETNGDSFVAVGAACFDSNYSTTIPLATVGVISLPNTLAGFGYQFNTDPATAAAVPIIPISTGPQITRMALFANIEINSIAIESYYKWLQGPSAKLVANFNLESIQCTFPLSFIAPETTQYSVPAPIVPGMLDTTAFTWGRFSSILDAVQPTPAGLTPGYISKNVYWNQYWNHPVPETDYQTGLTIHAGLDKNSFTINSLGFLTLNIHGLRLTQGDVLLMKFVTNTTAVDERIVNPRDQGYSFAAPTEATAATSCYNLFYPSAMSATGILEAASPDTYRPQRGGVSNTFVLTITKGSSGSYPQFVCTAALTPMATLPYKGYIVLQRFTARQYSLLTQRTTLPNRIPSLYPSCGGVLDTFEQVRWCPWLVGLLDRPVDLGVTVIAQGQDVAQPLSPVSITFTVNVAPDRQNAFLVADLAHFRFAAFYGCPGYPDSSFYGQLGTDLDAGKLTISIPNVGVDDLVITCNFLSSRYIQPIYLSESIRTTAAEIAERPSIPFEVTLALPDENDKSTHVIVYSTFSSFKSSYSYPDTHSAMITIPVDRSALLGSGVVAKGDLDKAEAVVTAPQRLYINDPYLDATEVTTLTAWIHETLASSILPIIEGSSAVLFTRVNAVDMMVAKQEFNSTDSLLKVSILLTSLKSAATANLYAAPFATPEAWMATSKLKIISSATLIEALDLEEGDIKSKMFIPLENMVESGPIFTECRANQCGGNCQPCVRNDKCYNSYDCRYGLYCWVGDSDSKLVFSQTGEYRHSVIKEGLITAPGTCQPLGYGLTTPAAIKAAERVQYTASTSRYTSSSSNSASKTAKNAKTAHSIKKDAAKSMRTLTSNAMVTTSTTSIAVVIGLVLAIMF